MKILSTVLLLLVYAKACVINEPMIDSDVISKRGLQRVGNVIYLLANTRPTLSCETNLTSSVESEKSEASLQWFYNGHLQNASRDDVRSESRMRIVFVHDAGRSFHRRELKCRLTVSNGCFKESTVFLEVAKPVSDIKAFFGPNQTTTLSARVDTQFSIYCSADGSPEPTYMWHAMYPGSTLWNEVGFSRNLTEYVVEEELPGPTLYRCQAANLANRDTTFITSPVLELTRIESEVVVEPTWVVTVRSLEELKANSPSDDNDNGFKVKLPIIVTLAILGASVLIAIVVLLGVMFYIKYRRRRLEHSDSDHKNVSQAMKPYHPDPPSKSLRSLSSNATEYSSTYSVDEYVHSYMEVIPDSGNNVVVLAKNGDVQYLTPKSSPKFLPLPNIPGQVPSSSSRNSLANSEGEENYDECKDNEGYDEKHIYNEIPLYENDIITNGDSTGTTKPSEE